MNNAGDIVGPWTLVQLLGTGGNAAVWEAVDLTSTNQRPIALKLINVKRSDREPYRRFVNEISVLRSLGDVDGILPVVASHLPDRPTKADRPWLAMPIARMIQDALADAELADAVSSIARVARTLEQLQLSHGIAHRDLKPANLYKFEGRTLVGDFGLVAAPDLEDLTRSGRPLGPAHFTAYEMIVDPVNADPHPADVFSLAKTLWVLCTQQHFPPEGHQSATTRIYSIADLRPHGRAHELDRLIDRCTRLNPNDRPTKTELATELEAWLQLSTRHPVSIDVGDVGARVRERLAQELRDEDLAEQWKEHAYAAARDLQELIKPLNDTLRAVHPRPAIDTLDDKDTQNILKSHEFAGAPQVLFRWQRCSKISAGREGLKYELKMGRSLELTEDGTLSFRALVHVGLERVFQSDYNWQSDVRKTNAGSIETSRILEDGVAEIALHLEEALEIFVEKLPRDRSQ